MLTKFGTSDPLFIAETLQRKQEIYNQFKNNAFANLRISHLENYGKRVYRTFLKCWNLENLIFWNFEEIETLTL